MRRVLTLALAALGTVSPMAAGAKPVPKPTGTITVKAARHARLVVTLDRPVTLWLQDQGDVDGPIIAGGGAHAGFLLVPVGPAVPTVGMVRTPAARSTSVELVAGGEVMPSVPAGRYTLEVVADRAVDIRIRSRGLTTTWAATSPLSVKSVTATFADGLGNSLVGNARLQVSTTSTVLTVAVFRVSGTTASAQWCVAHDADCRSGAMTQESRAMFTSPQVEQQIGADFQLSPRSLPSGSWSARWILGADALVREPAAYALVIG